LAVKFVKTFYYYWKRKLKLDQCGSVDSYVGSSPIKPTGF